MGSSFAKFFDRLFSKKEMRILILGLDAAGKTTILYQLKLGKCISTIPTIGFNVEIIEYKNIKFIMWDIGWNMTIRQLYRHYYQNTQAIIFVIDSIDKERITLAQEELSIMLQAEELRDAVLLVLANKQDIACMSVSEISEQLKLDKIVGRKWFIQGTCAVTGQGLHEGLEWLSKEIYKKKK